MRPPRGNGRGKNASGTIRTRSRPCQQEALTMTRSSGAVLSRRTFLRGSASLTAAGVVASALPRTAAGQDNLVVVNTWGGSWTAAEEAAYFKPFTEKTGIQVKTVAPVSFAKLKAQVQTKNYEWDVSVINAIELGQAEKEGLLEPIDWSIIRRETLWPNA